MSSLAVPYVLLPPQLNPPEQAKPTLPPNDCVQRMQGKASDLGCNSGDIACLCRNRDFFYGIRDCSFQACNSTLAQEAVAYGVKIYGDAGVVIATTPEATVTQPTGTATVIAAPVVSTIFTVITDGDKTITSAIGETTIAPGPASGEAGETRSFTAVSTATFTTVISSGGSLVTSVGESTIFSPVAVASGATTAPGEGTATGSGAAVPSVGETIATSGAEATATESHETGQVTSHTQEATESPTGEATSESSSGFAPKQTAGPVGGLLAAAGLAAMLI
ncbi:GPI-anchored CFEM domain protein [Colletotrichum sidae]|uniref:GPI-anchored CFEM domain protein n=1 Tax=Colletotrichum sidae TaxID=1347389 RepID=A0A4R8TCF7_9PEZI|nr:GPI-anchored CFEM domain protein [Colletotrichum sidae]